MMMKPRQQQKRRLTFFSKHANLTFEYSLLRHAMDGGPLLPAKASKKTTSGWLMLAKG